MKLKSIERLNSKERISSIDIFRATAILAVVVYHFHKLLPYGYIGVDLFFVISGFLVGSILIKKLKAGDKINYIEFFIQRGFKIWPSYYFFLAFGTLLAFLFYQNTRPAFIINPGQDMLRYLFFYLNYQAQPFHWPFGHLWSLCVEEHFYLAFPIVLIFIQTFFGSNIKVLLLTIASFVLIGIVSKYLSITFTEIKDSYNGTHNRVDALGWGLLLSVIITFYGEIIRVFKYKMYLFVTGLCLLGSSVLFMHYTSSFFYKKVVFHSIVPFCFFLMMLGVFYFDFSKWRIPRLIAYHSYNWYLWHPLYVNIVGQHFGFSFSGLLIYMVLSFCTAFLFTIIIEETFLRIRPVVINWIFPQKKLANIRQNV